MSESNPFEVADDQDEDNGAPKETSTITELRKAYDRADKDRKALANKVEELTAFQHTVIEEKREAAVGAAFTEVGLNPQHAKLFKALNPEVEVEAVTAEAVARFAAEYGLAAASGEPVVAPEDKPEGYKPVVTGTASPLAKFSSEEFQELSWEDQKAAIKSGRVEREAPPWRTQG